ncbi:hypothetical protein [Campylobacter lanienae]|uniref:hypothetical protein n=1 Tax=Campylobacter lanienae TaxID=75658 RepID=UPI00242E0787|nr:hypothetical protein [Campylobacter lanienae]MDD5787011.1 hypothetical protein [Campylobacter lanienae]
MWGNFLGGLADFGKNIFKDFKATDFLNAGGQVLGGIGQYKAAKSQGKMAQDIFNYNKTLMDEERKRRKKADEALAAGFRASDYAKEI